MRGFSPGVRNELKHYVYRLIDPRDGHTFYVGMGQGNRVFDHTEDALAPNAEENDQRLKGVLIPDLHDHGLEPLHIIHRHGIESKGDYIPNCRCYA